MVFYRCSTVEFDSLARRSIFVLDSLSAQFEASRERITPFLRKVGIEPLPTSASKFLFLDGDSTRFIRKKFEDLFGVVLYKPGKKPVFLRGVVSDVMLLNRMKNYYSIK